jgi:hypothetical protein
VATVSMSGLTRTVKFRDAEHVLALDDLTWEETSRYLAITGVEASEAFAVLFNPRLLLVLVYLQLARTDDQLRWTTFAREANPYSDLELVLPADDEPPAEPAKPKRRSTRRGDTEGEA